MKYEEKYDLLLSCYDSGKPLLDSVEYRIVVQLASDNSSEIRSLTAKALVWDADNPAAAQLLHLLAKDEDPLVRTEALDSLSSYCDKESIRVLRQSLCDPNNLVRTYAALGFAESSSMNATYADTALRVLSELCKNEADELVRAAILEGMYILGRKSSLLELFSTFNSNDYHVQCFIANALCDVLSRSNYEVIADFYRRTKLENLPYSVSEAIKRLGAKVEALANLCE